jgi:hypothetical protein
MSRPPIPLAYAETSTGTALEAAQFADVMGRRSASSRPYHAVRFYDNEESLAKIVAEFLADGLTDGMPGIVVATPAQRAAIVRELGARGLNVVSLKQSDDLVLLDAADTLSSFMANAKLDAGHLDCITRSQVRYFSREEGNHDGN